MSQLHPQPHASPATDPGLPADPLSGLYKMQTTAGLGSGDYVEINQVAVWALIVGVAGALCLFTNVLLILPLAGVVLGVMGFQQVRNSGGTQSGTMLAVGGVLLSLGFGGFVAARDLSYQARTRSDREAIDREIGEIGAALVAGKYADAYARLSPNLTNRVPAGTFADRWTSIQSVPYAGRLTRIEWAKRAFFRTDDVTDEPLAELEVRFVFEKNDRVPPQPAMFRKLNGSWRLDDLPVIFPKDSPPGADPAGPQGPPRPR